MLFAISAPIFGIAGDQEPTLKEERSFGVFAGSEFNSNKGKSFTVTRLVDEEKHITCYITTAGGISCLLSGGPMEPASDKEKHIGKPGPDKPPSPPLPSPDVKKELKELSDGLDELSKDQPTTP